MGTGWCWGSEQWGNHGQAVLVFCAVFFDEVLIPQRA